MFSRQHYHSFEVHKLPDGTGRLLVFCTPEDAARLRGHQGVFEITAHPDRWEGATELVAIPLHRIVNSLYKPVRRDGNAIPLRIGPEQ